MTMLTHLINETLIAVDGGWQTTACALRRKVGARASSGAATADVDIWQNANREVAMSSVALSTESTHEISNSRQQLASNWIDFVD
ncbi:unnamed protein product [Sphagnum balticum]